MAMDHGSTFRFINELEMESVLSYSISQSIVNRWHPLSRRRERVRVRAVELKAVLIQPTTPHPHPFSRLREKGVNSSIEIELE
jgi:hypothetical protein